MNRREFLEALGLSACAGWLVAACGPSAVDDEGDIECSRNADSPPSDWVEVRLSEHPELAQIGGSIKVDRPDHYLKVHVVHWDTGCYIAAGRVCTHGACELDVNEVVVSAGGQGAFSCPCHGSQFGPDGRVVSGPATEPIGTFEIQKTEESLWIKPPQIG